ncbi:MAG: GvpL/GvpF family gas vesicle protein [uncultured bacterium]|nr:MAG: GvpL/GvpF family gas vesicle protein [uncultured bacterium]
MAYVIYGVVREPAIVGAAMTGLQGRDVKFVAGCGLCAAVSEITGPEGTPPVAELLAYCKVVEDLHRLQAVVPMRYGCFLGGIEEIRDALKERRRQYTTLLAQLAGHVEMGLRILLPENGRRPRQEETTTGRDAFPPPADGRGYLALRKRHYQMQNEIVQGCQENIDRYIQSFSGLFTKHRTETDSKNGGLVCSLYFLTPETMVDRFRQAFGRTAENGHVKAMLSGPWPPYNFVTSDLAAAKLLEDKIKGENNDGICNSDADRS